MSQRCCPHFLDGNKQVTPAELLPDVSLQKLRRNDEGVFSRLTDEELAASVIPSHRVKYRGSLELRISAKQLVATEI